MNFQNKLNKAELDYMTRLARKRFDKIMLTLRSMPRSMLLVIR